MANRAGNQFGAQSQEPFVSRRSGQIMRANGPPSDTYDYVAGVYVDASDDHKLFIKRKPQGSIATWGNWIYELPIAIAPFVKWYGDHRPSNSLGSSGDYFLLWDCNNPSVDPLVFGPRGAEGWPENGEGVNVCPGGGYADETLAVGVLDEAGSADTLSDGLGAVGVLDEITLDPTSLDCFTPLGVLTWGTPLTDFGATLNPEWNADPSILISILGLGLLTEE